MSSDESDVEAHQKLIVNINNLGKQFGGNRRLTKKDVGKVKANDLVGAIHSTRYILSSKFR